MKTLGFREMHEDQVAELMNFIELSLNAAAMADQEIYDEMFERAQDVVHIFGGSQLFTQTVLEI